MSTLTTLDMINGAFIRKHPKDVARYLESSGQEQAVAFLSRLDIDRMISIWKFFTPANKETYFQLLPVELAADLLMKVEVAQCAALLNRIPKALAEGFLEKLPSHYASYVKEYMSYPENAVGSIMDKVSHTYYESMTVKQALEQIKKHKLTRSIYLYVVDNEMNLQGRVNIQKLITADDNDQLSSIATTSPVSVDCFSARDEAMSLMEKSKLDSLPVVAANNQLVGIIYASHLLDDIKEEVSTSIQTMVGASAEEKALSPSLFAVRKRLPWLAINLLTAFLAASVVGVFEDLIAKFTALAILLPVVAGQSGNAGAQALAVTMRGLALREVSISHWLKVVIKEMVSGCISGFAIAILCALTIIIWDGSIGLALILAISMTCSVAIACVSGAIVPMMLKRLGQDPAQSSSIILTTITDITGFFSFLGTAMLLSQYI